MTRNADETKKIAVDLASTLHGGEVVLLVGDLGAGKTTFVQGLAAALGSTSRVKSPTFAVMNEYTATFGAIRRIVHADLYRFSSADDVRALALDDEHRPDTVIVIEWPNAIAYDFRADHTVIIDHAGGDSREVTIQ